MEYLLNKINQKNLKIIYKLLHDLLLISLVFLMAELIAEGVLPGIITQHVGFSKVIILLFFIIFGIYILGNFLKVNLTPTAANKKTVIFLLLVLALLIFNSLLKLNIFLNIFILLAVLATSYFTYKTLLDDRSRN